MIARFQVLMAVAILMISANIVYGGAKNANPPSQPAPQNAARNQIAQQLQYASGLAVKLVLLNDTRVTGRVTGTSSDRVAVQILIGDKIVNRTIPFTQIKKVSYRVPGHPYAKLIGGTAVGSGILVVIILAAVGAL